MPITIDGRTFATMDEVNAYQRAQRLIQVAAPVMLAALETVDKLWRAHRGLEPDDPFLSPEMSEAWSKVRAAIAKARGREPWQTGVN